MPAFKLPKQFHPDFSQPNKKPVGPLEIDWSNPITQGLIGAYVFNRHTGYQDLVSKQHLSVFGSTSLKPVGFDRRQNFGVSCSDDQSSYMTGDSSVYRARITDKLTAFIDIDYRDATSGGTNGFLFGDVQLTGTDYNWGIYIDGSANYNVFLKNGSGTSKNTPDVASGAVNGGDFITDTLCLRYDSTNLDFLRNGSQAATTTQSGNVQSNALNLSFDRWNSANDEEVNYRIALIFARALSDHEIKALHDNPYQILKPAIPFYYFTGAAAGGTTINASLESLSLITNAANINAGYDISAALESLLLTESAATVNAGTDISASLESLTLTENQATVALDVTISAALESLSISEFAATVSSGTNISASLEFLAITEQAATVNTGTDISASLESIQVTENGATVSLGTVISAATESLNVTANAAGVSLDIAIAASIQNLLLTELQAQVGISTDISANLESLTITESGATIQTDTGITATLQSLTLSTFAATISSSTTYAQAGLEFTLQSGKLHFTMAANKTHYTIPVGKLHFTFKGD